MVRKYFKDLYSPPKIIMKAEHALWVAFLERTVIDLLKKPRKNASTRHIKEIEENRRTAALFFFSNGNYYTKYREKVFLFAGIDPEASLRHLRRKHLELSEMWR